MLNAHIGVVEGVACSNRGRGGGLRALCLYRGGRGGGMLKPGDGRAACSYRGGRGGGILKQGEGG
jgi:hypothetical protein